MASGRSLYKYLLIAGISLFLVTCSVEKNTETTRFYHSLTARFNIYFNGYESYKAGLLKISNGHHDYYGEILNVFESSDPATANMATGDMETAIQKASKLISLKSITAKPQVGNRRDISEKEKKLLDRKEYNEWVDDSYLLIGKARFHKHEFSEAESVFNYCVNEANDLLIKKEAMLWLARIKNETGDRPEANRLLNEFEVTTDLPRDLKAMYYSTLADLFIRQKKYQESTDPLLKALDLTSGKKNRYRLTYLLAQVYEQMGNSMLATGYYRKVVNMNPPYEVEFNARINLAGVFDVNSGNPTELKKELEKMLRDAKNKDFQDQIYFALGNLMMKEGKDSEALQYYRKSATATTGNQNQKGRAYLSLSEYHYKRSDYIKAGMYLDSAVFFLDQSHPQYAELQNRSRNLDQLVVQLIIIEREDSLQRIASLPEDQRKKIITDIIASVAKAENTPSDNSSDRYNLGQYYENERRFQGNIEQEGKWYFYNQAALTFGRTEFRRRWGTRRLEDNWRRGNKARNASLQNTGEDEESPGKSDADTLAAITDTKNPAYYLRDLPLTDSLMKVSDEKIAGAMINAGKAYVESIKDTVKGAETFEKLIVRYPGSPFIPEALYNLYRLNEKSNKIKAETYRQRLIEKYPDSEYALILSDPDYFRNKLRDLGVIEKLYEEAYNLYVNERFEETVSKINEALYRFPENQLSPKFMLLHAYAIARSSGEKAFKDDLRIMAETYPGTPESKKALELIAHINQQVPELKIEDERIAAAELYIADTTVSRTFVLIIPDPSFNLNQATFDVISYNIDYYTNKNFKTEGAFPDKKYIMVTVSGFQSFAQAMEYRRKFESAKPVRNPGGIKMVTFIIGGDNLSKFREDGDPERYDVFFRENFEKNTLSQTDQP
ncbi:MAG TPA: tetratricopeptide repeat protein [Bacteroidales bacterium]|nr:tetratricopeptide repeat protein [Bacteroidales bacterium]